MNMRSIVAPINDEIDFERTNLVQRAISWVRKRSAFLLVVAAPTLIIFGYYYLIAADQYESETHFIIRKSEAQAAVPSGIGQILGFGAGAGQLGDDAASVSDYLVSHDAVSALNKQANLVQMFRRPEADALSRLNSVDPSPEKLLKYYKGMVAVHTDHESGITVLRVRAFRSDDAYDIVQRMLSLGEQRVNQLNARSYNDAVANARQELLRAEDGVSNVQRQITGYRQSHGDVDPQGSGEAQIKLVSELTGNLTAARAQLATMGALIGRSSPQYIALEHQVRSLEAQAAAQSGHAAGTSSTSIASTLGGYEDLRLRQEFAAKRYEAAAANLQKAEDQAQRQQLYLVRVVEPNRPVKSLYPQRARILLTTFIGLILVYSIGWLIGAGVREHAA